MTMSFSKSFFAISALALIILVWFAGYVWFLFSVAYTPITINDKASDAIIVLTGGNYRIKTGMELLAGKKAPQLFISGVHPDVSRKKILAMWGDSTPAPDCCISLGRQATTTTENAQEVRKWLSYNKYKSIHLVTSAYHMRRALLEFTHALPNIDITPLSVTYKDYTLGTIKFWVITFSEYHKWLLRVTYLSLHSTKKAQS